MRKTSRFLSPALIQVLMDPLNRITVLSGAGISAESGIPTFRGPEGYWTLGSRGYMPEEIATLAMCKRHPREVWEWYLYRLGVCLHAQANDGHRALVQMEERLGDRFTLITQNIDNLHIRAGNSLERTLQIHGNINFTRCSNDTCNTGLGTLHESLRVHRAQKDLRADELALLHCPTCRDWLRPHVLWFDEYYDEEHFRFDSSLLAARRTDLLIIVGTSGATALPMHVATLALENNAVLVDINPEENPFSAMARSSPQGLSIREKASAVLVEIADFCALEA